MTNKNQAYTYHAEHRMNQRGIKQEAVDILLDYGREGFHHGAMTIYMDKGSHAEARRTLGAKSYAKIAKQLNIYLIIGDDGAIVTVGKRTCRLKFN